MHIENLLDNKKARNHMITQKQIDAIEKALSDGLRVEIVPLFDKETRERKAVVYAIKRVKIE